MYCCQKTPSIIFIFAYDTWKKCVVRELEIYFFCQVGDNINK